MSSSRVKILIVDDDEDDVYLTKEAFRRAKFDADIIHVSNGIECMKFLRNEGEHHDASVPNLVLLDINMPMMDGREVLKEIVADPKLRNLPVVVLTTSDADSDVEYMYSLRCSSYIVKPVDFAKFQAAIKELTEYWFQLVSIPVPR